MLKACTVRRVGVENGTQYKCTIVSSADVGAKEVQLVHEAINNTLIVVGSKNTDTKEVKQTTQMSFSVVFVFACLTSAVYPKDAGLIPAMAVAFHWRHNARGPCTA